MDNQPDSAAELVERCRRGEADAVQALFVRYAQRLTRVAEEHLSRRVARREDGEDVVQSVFRTFFRRCAAGQFSIAGDAQTWRLLVQITLRKAREVSRRHHAERRDVAVEDAGPWQEWLAETASREPGPVEAAALVDQIDALLQGLPALYAQVLQMALEGHSRAETARLLGVSRQTIYRVLTLMQQRLERSLPQG